MNNCELPQLHGDIPLKAEEVKNLLSGATSERRYFLLGKLCLAERDRRPSEFVHDVYASVGREFGYSETGLRRYVLFAKAIDYLQSVAPEIVPGIMGGTARISYENAIALSRKGREEILRIAGQLADASLTVNSIFQKCPPSYARRKRNRGEKSATGQKPATIKDTPEHDPDAQVSSLSYTIPSWVGVVDNVFMNTDFNQISLSARYKLRKELALLAETAKTVLDILSDLQANNRNK
jgi:hypothetical protein